MKSDLSISRWLSFGIAVSLVGLLPVATQASYQRTPIKLPSHSALGAGKLPGAITAAPVWHSDLEAAMVDAATTYRPIFALFTSPDCGWCLRFKRDVLPAPEVAKLLKHYSLVEVDVTEDKDTAQQFQLRGVPAIIILSADGSPRNAVSGYVPAASLVEFLSKELNPELVGQQDEDALKLLEALKKGSIASNQWDQVMLAFGNEKQRGAFWETLMALDQLPGKQLVPLLTDSRLAVRLGTLDLLEEITGDTFGFDPWLSSDHADNASGMAQWHDWSIGVTGGVETVYMPLSQDAIERHMQDLVSGDIHRAQRAMRMLQTAGPSAAVGITDFIAAHPELPEGAMRRIKEVQYTLWLPDLQGVDAHAMAHHLTFGTLDMQLKALRQLRIGGSVAVPVLRDFLASPDSIIRETAAESLLLAVRAGAIGLITQHIETETDVDVI
jgi:thioredoxin-related protein